MSKNNNTEKIPFVIFTNEWIDKWLSVLNETELKAYMKLAYHYNHEKGVSFPGQDTIKEGVGIKSKKPIVNALSKLEDLDLIEKIKKHSRKGWPSNQYRMLHVDGKGYHRAARQRTSIKEAVAENEKIMKFLTVSPYKYNSSKEMLEAIFDLSPEYKDVYYDRGFNKEEDFDPWFAFLIYSISSFRHKYEDLERFWNQKNAIRQFTEAIMKWEKRIEKVKEEMKAQWNRVIEDYDYCGEYVINKYPEYISILQDAFEHKSKGEKKWNKRIKEIIEKFPDIKEIQIYYNYGIFKELSAKYGMATQQIASLVEYISLQNEGMIGVIFDSDGYACEVHRPDIKLLISDEEYRLIYLELEDEIYKDPETGKTEIVSKGFTKSEKRDFKGTLKKIEAAKRKAVSALVEKVGRVLAELYIKGKIREEDEGYEPDRWYWKKKDDGWYTHEIERGYHPARMGLEDLLKHISYEINSETQDFREYDDVKVGEELVDMESKTWGINGEPREDALVPIPPISVKEIRDRFEFEKEKLLTEQKETKNAVK